MVGAEMPHRSRGGFPLAGARAAASHVWVSLILGLILLPGSWARSGGRVSGTFSGTVIECLPSMGGPSISLAGGSFSCAANE